MNSIIQAKLKLPMDFLENLYKQFGNTTANKILNGMSKDRNTTLRVNKTKIR